MSQPDTLSIHRSFVLRLYAGADPNTGEISGRVEHIVSGESQEFHSMGELFSSIGLLLHSEVTGTKK